LLPGYGLRDIYLALFGRGGVRITANPRVVLAWIPGFRYAASGLLFNVLDL